MDTSDRTKLDNLLGANAVLRELVVALITTHPARAELLQQVLSTTQQWQDLAQATTQSDATLAGMAQEQQRLQTLLDSW